MFAMNILQSHNHNVFVVSNGLEAVETVKKCRYDVILMDVQMPVMGGFEATGKIREYERESGLQRTPIIALTAHAMLGDREKCIQAQMGEYLSKPLKPNQMMQTILKCAPLVHRLLDRCWRRARNLGSRAVEKCTPSTHLSPIIKISSRGHKNNKGCPPHHALARGTGKSPLLV